jgi:hypothetical protein
MVDKALRRGWAFVAVYASGRRLMRRGQYWIWGHYDGRVSR